MAHGNTLPRSPDPIEKSNSKDVLMGGEDRRLILGDLQSIASEINEQEGMNGVTAGGVTAQNKNSSTSQGKSLDFERIVNSYSIKTARELLLQRICKLRNNGDSHTQNYSFDKLTPTLDIGMMNPTVNSLFDGKFSIMEMEESDSVEDNLEGDSVPTSFNSMSSFQYNDPFIRLPKLSENLFAVCEGSKYEQAGKPSMFGYSGRTAMRWVLTCAAGLFTGLVTVFILFSVESLVVLRSNYLIRAAAEWHYPGVAAEWMSFLALAGYNSILAISSSAMCLQFAPAAVGSGIPEVKAYLNGVRVSRFADPKLFFAKVFGTILSVSSGLAVGPEGPLVHIGAIIGALITKTRSLEMATMNLKSRLSRLIGLGIHVDVRASERELNHSALSVSKSRQCNCWSAVVHQLSQFRSDEERRDFVSAGAACGFAAAFGAPVGGVLFSLEEASSFFAHKMLFKTLTATVLATFCIAIYHGNLLEYSALQLTVAVTPNVLKVINRLVEIPFYVFVGACGGLLGAAFNGTCLFTNTRRKLFYGQQEPSRRFRYKIVEVFIYSIVTSAILFSVSLFAKWACKEEDEGLHKEDINGNALSSQFNCKSGYYNEIFKILLGSREDAIRGILSNPSAYDPRTLFTVGALFFVLMSITFGVSVPSGIFMPSILTGSALGGFAGICFQKYFITSLEPSTFALLGAAALLAGIQRNTVSLCVILMEGTGETKVLIPLIVTICVANYVGSLFNEGLYEILIEMKGYLYLEHGAKRSMDVVKISDLMSYPVECIFTVESAGSIEELLLSTSHNGFPVVDKESGQFVGLVRRDQLVALLECGIFMEECRESVSDTTDRKSLPPSVLVGNHIASINEQQRLHDPSSKVAGAAPATVFGADCWLRETVQPLNGLITLDADDTLPKGIFPAKDDTVVTLRDGKLVVLLADNDRRQLVNVAAIMNRGAYSVPEMFPLSKCYSMFTALGLRHLVVLGKEGKVSGMITRYNLSSSYLEKRLKFKLP